MMRSRRRAASSDDQALVTYSRMPVAEADDQAAPRALDDAEPYLDAVEVPLVGASQRPEEMRVVPELGGVAGERPASVDVDDVLDDRKRSGAMRFVTLAVVVLIAAGIGVFAASHGLFGPGKPAAAIATATDPDAEIAAIQAQIAQLAKISGAEAADAREKIAALSKRLVELEQKPADTAPADELAQPGIRQIPLDGSSGATASTGEAAPAAPVEPPVPRSRPDKPVMQPASAEPAMDEPPVAAPAAKPPKAVARKTAEPDSDQSFIDTVEKALADSQGRPPPKPAAPAVIRPVIAEPPPALPQADAAPAFSLRPLAPADVDPSAPPAPLVAADPPVASEPQQKLPPGVKLPPADIPNVAPSDQQY